MQAKWENQSAETKNSLLFTLKYHTWPFNKSYRACKLIFIIPLRFSSLFICIYLNSLVYESEND